ncbi:DNA-directed RNA polymerase, mitochondrial [Nephila pilipes]|nr:DNA-directed RNA polymerase, mitochondrial [Nephila pilipes]
MISRTNYKTRLKPKPYEELLKVLEARKQDLSNKEKFNCDCDSFRTISLENPNISDSFNKDFLQNDHETNHSINEGIYTVKYQIKEKKSKISECNETNKKSQKQKKKSKLSTQQEDVKRSTKHLYALRTLKSYVEVNIYANELEKTQMYLRRQLHFLKKKYKLENINYVDLYNLLISGWARKGRVDKIKQVFSIMKEDQVSPNLESYACYLEGISKSKFIDVIAIELVVKEMKSQGLSPEDIFKECIFKGDQREKVIEALGFVGTNIPSESYEASNAYCCKLLEKLNDKSYEKDDRYQSFGFGKKDINFLASGQLEMENRYTLKIASVDINTSKSSNVILKSRRYLEELEDTWRKKLSATFKKVKSIKKSSHMRGYDKEESIYPFIAVIDSDILVNILVQQVRTMAETGEYFCPFEKALFRQLGIKVMNHYFIWLNKTNKVTDKVHLIYKEYLHYLLDKKLLSEYTPREYWEYLKSQNHSGPTIDIANTPWPPSVLTRIGSEMFDILHKVISFDPNRVRNKPTNKISTTPVFYITYEEGYGSNDMKISRHIGTHDLLCKLYRDAKLDYLEFDTTLVPMLSPPKPWIKCDSGGLLITTTPFIRLNDHAIHQTSYYSKVPSKNLNPCFDSLNSLSLCPWIINKPVLNAIISVFQKGGDEHLDVPLNPDNFSSAPKIVSTMSQKEKAIIWKHKRELKKKKCEASSLWFDCLYKLSIANHFRDKIFWFPHNLDFRGRTYPTPPHFNHLGSDLVRSILLFAEGEPLGENGLDWLKIQLINLTGFRKRNSHSERLKFANEMIPEILDSADRPFEGNQWWKTSDKPWQTLACCKELTNALRHPNPEEYVSHFPIHQDGSCNGLQHYAALGRDELGAIEVNLHPSNAPQDVYSGVSNLVEKLRQKDAANGEEVAKALDGFVRRKVVKQTVMTFVYGVTRYGAKLQILKQLKDMPDFPEKYHQQASSYLMQKIFLSIKEMFTATQEIQDWFTDCAEYITRVSGEPLEWITPLGLPVIQPYHKETVVTNKCSDPGKESSLNYTSSYEPYQSPNIRKQKNGFAPNFIHSLDASHMMLTSLFCQRKGITFVSVHDCYWTHALTVETMNKICREQFVSLHKEPILEDLSAFFLDKYARVVDEKIQGRKLKKNSANKKLRDVLSAVPEKGTFNLDNQRHIKYLFQFTTDIPYVSHVDVVADTFPRIDEFHMPSIDYNALAWAQSDDEKLESLRNST